MVGVGRDSIGTGMFHRGRLVQGFALRLTKLFYFTGPQVQIWASIGSQVAKKIHHDVKERQEML